MTTPATRWQASADAWRRGDPPPADPDAADGWYYEQNATALRWAAPRALAGFALVMLMGWLPFALFGVR